MYTLPRVLLISFKTTENLPRYRFFDNFSQLDRKGVVLAFIREAILVCELSIKAISNLTQNIRIPEEGIFWASVEK